jgi:membrane-associated PAP2 superfamily phosphatase
MSEAAEIDGRKYEPYGTVLSLRLYPKGHCRLFPTGPWSAAYIFMKIFFLYSGSMQRYITIIKAIA